MIYPELQNIVYGAAGYPYPGWHDVCWGGCTFVQYRKFFRTKTLSK